LIGAKKNPSSFTSLFIGVDISDHIKYVASRAWPPAWWSDKIDFFLLIYGDALGYSSLE
jgi:hypothetical protein